MSFAPCNVVLSLLIACFGGKEMTVRELRTLLDNMDPEAPVLVVAERYDNAYHEIRDAEIVHWLEENPSEGFARVDQVVVLHRKDDPHYNVLVEFFEEWYPGRAVGGRTLDEQIESLRAERDRLAAMADAGVWIDLALMTQPSDFVQLATDELEVADRFGWFSDKKFESPPEGGRPAVGPDLPARREMPLLYRCPRVDASDLTRARSIEDLVRKCPELLDYLTELRAAGVWADLDNREYVTGDPNVAQRFSFLPEKELSPEESLEDLDEPATA
jgi:hypothetical protein